VYDPGRAYIAPSGYHAQVNAAPAVYAWGTPYEVGYPGPTGTLSSNAQGYADNIAQWGTSSTAVILGGVYPALPTVTGQYSWTSYYVVGTASSWRVVNQYVQSVLVSAAVLYQAAYYDNPGQSYIAPHSSGGPQFGPVTSITLNSITNELSGGYDSGGIGTDQTVYMASTGAGQALDYTVPITGYLTYYYEI
jgi:hypothetical protein